MLLGCGSGEVVEAQGGESSTTEGSMDTGGTSGGASTTATSTSDTTASATASGEGSTTSSTSEGLDGTTTSSSDGLDDGSDDSTGGEPLGPVASCYEGVFVNDPDLGPDYDQFDPVVGSHCLGTNHQDIVGVDRVVFLGDSITVGTPPSWPNQFYRSRLANALRDEFGLSYGFLESLWKSYDPFNGTASVRQAGDFWSCARWGGRNDDLLEDDTQLEDCFPPNTWDQRTLAIVTSGGNDIANLTRKAIDGVPQAELWDQAIEMIAYKQDAIEWMKDPQRFPNGNFVVFANIYEFTDATGDVQSCDVSGLAGFEEPVPSPDELAEVVTWIEEEYMRMAVETGSDMIFLFEEFCGRGFNYDDPTAPCYRGPGEQRWFDLTCTHPNPTGHQAIANMFMAVVEE